jgi:gamma-glutamylcyclotransferase (GGCT)/AIG2-like uncharacterized protein YtfP
MDDISIQQLNSALVNFSKAGEFRGTDSYPVTGADLQAVVGAAEKLFKELIRKIDQLEQAQQKTH